MKVVIAISLSKEFCYKNWKILFRKWGNNKIITTIIMWQQLSKFLKVGEFGDSIS